MFNFLRTLFLLPLLLLSTSAISNETVYVLTIPKSGSHCISKYFELLKILERPLPVKIESYSHFSEKYLGLPPKYFDRPEVKKILLIRDLRDVFNSSLHHIENTKSWSLRKVEFVEGWKDLSYEEKINEMINYTKKPPHIRWSYKDRSLPEQMRKTILRAISLSSLPNTLVVRFEDLSGGNGPESQLTTIREINAFIGLEISESDEEYIMDNLFGNAVIGSRFFRKGEIGQWKPLMSPSLCDSFKQFYGQELIDLKYEKDTHWTSSYQQ